MKALQKVAYGEGLIEIREVPVPELQDEDDVLIEIKAAGICGTDIHILHDKFTYYPPVTLGHEFSGEIIKLGKKVNNFKIGDRVVAEPHSEACMVCDLCRQGYWQICPEKRSPGWGRDGAFTDYIRMPAKLLHKIPENISYEIAALTEPTAIATNYIVERVNVMAGDTVTVIGAGPIGILCGMIAKECGASKVIMIGRDSAEIIRFKIALEMGSDRTINIIDENPKEVLAMMTNNKMSDVVIEASGTEQGIQSAFELVKVCGKICAVGITGKDFVGIPWDVGQKKMLDVFFNLSSSYTSWDRALAIMGNTRFEMERIITHRESIENWKRVFADLQSGNGIKALFIPQKNS